MNFNWLANLTEELWYLSTKLHDIQLFAVGWCVRDILLSRSDKPLDIDVTCAGEPLSLAKNIDKSDIHFFQTEKFGTFTMVPHTNEKKHYEVTPFRSEGTYTDLRHPDELNRTDDLLLDSQRRDFTINALYYTHVEFSHLNQKALSDSTDQGEAKDMLTSLDSEWIRFDQDSSTLVLQKKELIALCFPSWWVDNSYLFSLVKILSPDQQPSSIGVLVDPHQGLQDIQQRKIRCVWLADDRLQEDALRIIRWVRFAVTLYNFDFIKDTRQALEKHHQLVAHVAHERIGQEIMKALASNNFFGFVSLIDELWLSPLLFNHLSRNKFDHQPNRYHPFDTYTHTLLTLHELEKINSKPAVKLAMLYHDVGKKDQYEAMGKTETRKEAFAEFWDLANHSLSGQQFALEDMWKYGWWKKMIQEVQRYIGQHMRPGEILFSKPEKWKKKMRLLFSIGGYEKVRNLLDIVIADRLWQYNPLQKLEDSLSGVYELIEILDVLDKEEWQFTLKELEINGNDIINDLEIPPGPKVKELLNNAVTWVMHDVKERNTKKKIISYLRKNL